MDVLNSLSDATMETQLSSFNTKINEMPLLPPLISSDISIEIQYYKQLYIAVEQRLKALEMVKRNALQENKDELHKGILVKGDHGDAIDLFCKLDNDCVLKNMTSVASEGIDCMTSNKSDENLIDIDTCITNEVQNEILTTNDSQSNLIDNVSKSFTNDDVLNVIVVNEKVCKDDSHDSDTITASTDLHQYLNTSTSFKTDTTETTPEILKPQVPKTLDIVPITVDQSKPPDKLNLTDDENPKLVRQGSYVLDSPSPMLLAHMHSELVNTEYTPTSSGQSIKRKEWNINQVKAEWETNTGFKEPFSRTSSANKFRKTIHTNIPSQRLCKSVSNSKTASPLDVYRSANSVDCIQSMFAKECCSPKAGNNRASSQLRKYTSPANSTNSIRSNSFKKTVKSTSILNLANKLSGSLGSLSSVSPKPIKCTDKKNTRLNQNSDNSSMNSNKSSSPSSNQKPIITSEKIITVFREIQETHRKQMIELMERQQKEQMLMQENFKKQQILILAQIRKAFPEISISTLSEAITGKEHTTPSKSQIINCKKNSTEKQVTDVKQVNGINYPNKNKPVILRSPMDYTHSSKELSSTSCHLTIQPTTPVTTDYHSNNYQDTKILDDSSLPVSRIPLSNYKVIDDMPVGNFVRRHSSVSRQLFPLDSKTTHVPVLDNSIYTEKHIQAVTTINAYVKGFLVRRIMKTEKVIALKNTYKEALHCMLRLHVDAPLNLPELNFHQRLQLQCDAASMNIVDLFSQSPTKRMEIIAHDREIKKGRSDRPSSARSYSFATQRTLARKKLKEMGVCPSLQSSMMTKSCPARTRCQTWTSNSKDKRTTTSMINQGIKRSTSAGAVRKPWR